MCKRNGHSVSCYAESQPSEQKDPPERHTAQAWAQDLTIDQARIPSLPVISVWKGSTASPLACATLAKAGSRERKAAARRETGRCTPVLMASIGTAFLPELRRWSAGAGPEGSTYASHATAAIRPTRTTRGCIRAFLFERLNLLVLM